LIWHWVMTLLVCAAMLPAAANTLEGVLMPGKVIAGHAKYEDDCAKCHVKFNKAAQDGVCLDCHKAVAADMRSHVGYHGRIRVEPCRSCHTDHKGREMQIVPLDENKFDHAKTDFSLMGAHPRVACKTCHLPDKKFREAAGTCDGCHRQDDKHKGALGPLCADCHTQSTWKEARYDHSKTHFGLTEKHATVPCKDCHANNVFKDTPMTCVGCHRKDDNRLHRGRLGDKCETCHNARDWRNVTTFSHDRDTKFALRGKHRTAKCESCHTAPPSREKTPTTCVACHKADDRHNATLGSGCGDCHTERNWKEAKYDHSLSVFKLRARHRDVECKECHRDPRSYRGIDQTCIGCHRKDDEHKARYGRKCETCHTENRWRETTFRHDRDTKYQLLGRHAAVKCDSCHVGSMYQDKLTADCYACHRNDDKHRDQLGRQCDTCHDAVDWKETVRFDHGKSRFPLLGRHVRVECTDCHSTPAFKDANQECYACHVKDDRHQRTLGFDCANCHTARDWKIWDYNHDRKTRFTLNGAHRPLACVSCHKAPAAPGGKIPVLARNCVSCHRADDIHGGDFGRACERCHTTRNFREITFSGSRTLATARTSGATPREGARP
jgi:hypothetical protein